MANPDSIRRREREAKARKKRLNDNQEFHETLAAPVPNRTYRSEIDQAESSSTTTEQIVRLVSTALNTLLAVRFLVSLFSSDRSNGLVNLLYALTDWMARPFQALFGEAPANGNGFFDWPALAAVVVVSLLAMFLRRIIRAPRV